MHVGSKILRSQFQWNGNDGIAAMTYTIPSVHENIVGSAPCIHTNNPVLQELGNAITQAFEGFTLSEASEDVITNRQSWFHGPLHVAFNFHHISC